jgi:hypothetical protein
MNENTVTMYDETPVSGPSSFMVEANARMFAGIVFWGAIVGALVMGLQVLLRQFLIEPVLCHSVDAFSMCANGGSIALNSATVLIAIVGTVGLLKMSVYRPLLITLAAAASMWGANTWLGGFTWYEMTVWLVVLYAAAYGAYAWILRVYNFPVALVLTIALVVAARVVLQL